jgi:hypothetical protein
MERKQFHFSPANSGYYVFCVPQNHLYWAKKVKIVVSERRAKQFAEAAQAV